MTKNNRFSPTSEKGHFYGLVDEGKYLRQSLLYKQILPRPVRRSFSEGGTQSRLKTLCSLWLYSSCSSCASWLKNPFNQRNLRKPLLINDLSPCKALYTSSDSSTDAERSLQNHLFMQNKPNFRKNQMNVTDLLTRDYERKDTWSSGKNKPNSKPIQTQFKANTNPIQSQFKPKQTQFPKRPK